MDPIVVAAGTALVGAMATDSWQRTRDAVTNWWRRTRATSPEAVNELAADLQTLHFSILEARSTADIDTEDALVGAWRLRLQTLLADEPDLVGSLRQLVDVHLTPELSKAEQGQVRSVVMHAEAQDNARIYMAGNDQQINGT
ncbi:hypothetical protein [Streptomyces sp. NPDC060205]|uniref:hypothetical protein n=1 Tax=Streptomyces sp. NPDC060205 TaxID=3347072 RepID=UPI003665312D